MTQEDLADSAYADAKTPEDVVRTSEIAQAEMGPSRREDGLKKPTPTSNPSESQLSCENPPVRKIIVNRACLQHQTEIAMDALADSNEPPFLFQRVRTLVRVGQDENGNPYTETLNEDGIRGILERCAEFVKVKQDGSELPTFPPLDVVRDLRNLPEWLTIPPISGIVESPIILPDGRVITTKGYDINTRRYYIPSVGLKIPSIPEQPQQQDVNTALQIIQEIFTDFPFMDEASRTNMIAALFTAVLRPMISGPVPMAIIDKPQAGTGATLLSEVIALVSTGRSAPLMTAAEDDATWRKTITSTLLLGRNLAIVDNVETKLNAASLAAALTSNTWTDRILGKNDMITLPHNMFWCCTGNNIQLGGDLPRRCFWIRLDAQMARPWQRSDYRHPNLRAWVMTERGRILGAILTITRAWILSGRPSPDPSIPKMGSFEVWREIIGGILTFIRLPAFLGNLESLYEQADADSPQWEAFIEKWYALWPNHPVTVAEIQEIIKNESTSSTIEYSGKDPLVNKLPDNIADAWTGKKNFSRVLGKALSRMNGRVFLNGLILKKGKTCHNAITWIVTSVAENGGV